MVNRNDLWAETEELADLIIQAPEIAAFQEAEQKLKAHPTAQSMIQQLKDLQEKVGEFQARRVAEKHFAHLVKESESLLERLEKIPEVAEFQRTQTAVNELLKSVTERLATAVTERVEYDGRQA